MHFADVNEAQKPVMDYSCFGITQTSRQLCNIMLIPVAYDSVGQ